LIGLIWASRTGESLARHLERAWPDARAYPGPPAAALAAAWAQCDGVVACMAAGIAVRLAAPLLGHKDRDPGLVCVDDAGRFAVALAGGHGGGANQLATRVAGTLRATAVITTASEALGLPALDQLGADLGFAIEPGSDLAALAAALVGGDQVTLVSDQRWPLPPLPETVVPADEPRPLCLLITDRLVDPPRPAVVYRPPSLVVGVGCSRGAPAAEIGDLIDRALQQAGLSASSVAYLASVDAKRDEPGLRRTAGERGWPLRFQPSRALARIAVPNPSATVAAAIGTPSVAEASALAFGPAALIVPKRKSRHATVAIARLRPRGRLYVVGTGPGDPDLLPPLARAALARCELVVGLEQYLDRIRGLLPRGTRVAASAVGGELERGRLAVAQAAAGAAVALISGGDAGVYGMASPALATAPPEVEVIGVPGITAMHAAAALLGAPLGHDHCAVSLSDLLTPWPAIRRRLEAAAAGDFVISLYNPSSAGRTWQLEAARRLVLEHRKPSTPVGLVSDAYRAAQRVELTTLGELDPTHAGMTTIVVIGSSQTRMLAGRMVTPRGYPRSPEPPSDRRPSDLAVREPESPSGVDRTGSARQRRESEPVSPESHSGSGGVERGGPHVEGGGPHPETCSGLDARHRGQGPAVAARRTPPPGPPEPATARARVVHPIEAESYRILRSRLDLRELGPRSRAVVERIVHASGDPSYADDLVLDEAALEAGLAALRAGAPIVVDARMVAAAITARPTICALDLANQEVAALDRHNQPTGRGAGHEAAADRGDGTTPEAGGGPDRDGGPGPGGTEAPGRETPELGAERISASRPEATRSATGVRSAARAVGSGAIWVIGCAPTALAALLLADARPALVIGLPVGFVRAVEAKRALALSGLPAVTNRSVKGGSAVAAAALNALLYQEDVP
jgi:cobalt-precorrin 5A hydrolase / cobalt-factor III methyltransferase / precorrin-3B C17-methyltransferase